MRCDVMERPKYVVLKALIDHVMKSGRVNDNGLSAVSFLFDSFIYGYGRSAYNYML